jgi:hypothetical protein
MRAEHQRGQAAVELIGVACALGVALMLAWQLVVAAQAWQAAQSSARTAARAGAVGAPIVRAARTVLPPALAEGVQVDRITTGGRDVVRVRIRVPRVVPLWPDTWVDATAAVAR